MKMVLLFSVPEVASQTAVVENSQLRKSGSLDA